MARLYGRFDAQGHSRPAGSLSSKHPQAKWDGFSTLLQSINQVRNNRPPEPDPAWIPLLSSEFVREFATVEASRKPYLLDYVRLHDRLAGAGAAARKCAR